VGLPGIGSDVLLSLIGGFLYYKLRDASRRRRILSLPLATVGTSVLIVSTSRRHGAGGAPVERPARLPQLDESSCCCWRGLHWAFSVRVVQLMHHDITAADQFGTAFFYVTTGFHGLHVLGGVIWMGIILYRTLVQNVYTAENYLGVELFGLYWLLCRRGRIALFTVIILVH